MREAGRTAALLALMLAVLVSCQRPTVARTEPHAPQPPLLEPGAPEAAHDSSLQASAVPEPVQLAFAGDFNPPRPTPEQAPSLAEARWDTALGGLSGLYYNARDGALYAISDDSSHLPPRLYRFRVELSDTTLRVTPEAVILLREPTPTGLLADLDAECITFDRNGGFFIGTENGDDSPSQFWPKILRVTREGLITGHLPLPDAYLPELSGVPTRGPRTNLAFEGLSSSPSGRWLTAITETSLRQDGPLATFEHGTTSRLLRWDLDAPGAPPVEYRYQTEPVARPKRGEPRTLLNGVSELLSLDDQRQLVLERAYVSLTVGPGVNAIRIFETSIPSPAPRTDPSAASPLLDKRLVLDLDDVVEQFEAGQRSLDNFEGMTFGPSFPSGERSLLLVTDDNFNATERTVFLALRIRAAQSPSAH